MVRPGEVLIATARLAHVNRNAMPGLAWCSYLKSDGARYGMARQGLVHLTVIVGMIQTWRCSALAGPGAARHGPVGQGMVGWPDGGMADAQDLKSCSGYPECGFKSRSGYCI